MQGRKRASTAARGAAGLPECPLGAWQGLWGGYLSWHSDSTSCTKHCSQTSSWSSVPEQPPVRDTASFHPRGSCRVGAPPSNWCGQEVQRDLAPQLEAELDWRGGSVAHGFPSALAGAPTGRRPAAGGTNPEPRVQQVCLGKGWQRAPGQVGLEGWACAGEGRCLFQGQVS